jgi:hypothetical protein
VAAESASWPPQLAKPVARGGDEGWGRNSSGSGAGGGTVGFFSNLLDCRPVFRWFLAFAVTQLVEMPVYVRGARATWFEAFGASALTHPIVWFVVPNVLEEAYAAWLVPNGVHFDPRERWFAMFIVAETFAVVAEAVYLGVLRHKRPLMWAFIANMASVIVGLTSRKLVGYP